MTLNELFREVNKGPFHHIGLGLDFRTELIDGTRYIFFQCTAGNEDWLNNFKAWVKPYKFMRKVWYAHHGFSSVYHSGRDFILRAISGDEPIVAVGYSHGAALATLFHEDIRYNFPERRIETVAFGSPRVIWWPFSWNVKRFDDLTRIVRRGDIVTMVPTRWMLYRHVGKELRIGACAAPSHLMHYPMEYANNV